MFELLLLDNMCGFCCLSMRFVVFMDLLSTMLQPAGVLYILYLIYINIVDPGVLPLVSIIIIAGIYGLQIIIFLFRLEFDQVGWMIFYIFAMPIFSFFIPVYSFWHFDDFSWVRSIFHSL